MLTGQMIYVGHSKGDYEGVKFDNVELSDGIRKIKFTNRTGITDFSNLQNERSKVEVGVTLDVRGKGGIVIPHLLKIKEIK